MALINDEVSRRIQKRNKRADIGPGEATDEEARKAPKDASSNGIDEFAGPVTEEEEDLEIDKCRQQLGLLDSEMKNKDSWPQGFLEKLRSDESKMIAELDIAKQKLSNRQSQFKSLFLALLSAALMPTPTSQEASVPTQARLTLRSNPEDQILYQESQFFLLETKTLLEEYNSLSCLHCPNSELEKIRHTVESEREVAEKSIKAAADLTKNDTTALLAVRYHEVIETQRISSDDEGLGRGLLAHLGQDDQVSTHGWNCQAKKTYRAVKGLHDAAVKGLDTV